MNQLNIKQKIRKTDDIGKKLNAELKNLERPDLLANKNREEAA